MKFGLENLVKKKKEMSREELEAIIPIIDPDVADDKRLVEDSIKQGEGMHFVLTRDTLFITPANPESLKNRQHLRPEDCLIDDGGFVVENSSHTLKFDYLDRGKKLDTAHQVAQSKISDYLRRHDVQIDRIDYFEPSQNIAK